MTEQTTWLTQAAFDRLQNELEERKGPVRDEITTRISAAREEGDLKENGGYHAARDEQGKNEGRIAHLEQLLEHAMVGTPKVPDGEVHVGRLVTIKFAPEDTETYLIGSAEEASHSEHNVLSPDSPLGQSIIGKRIGDEISYELPNGRIANVVLVDVQNQ
ncbi:MAG: transcription elongation factor GreA [Actinobacteria bacterium]|nr:transcription elongation factor GreA [Actinomycetota bacterium]